LTDNATTSYYLGGIIFPPNGGVRDGITDTKEFRRAPVRIVARLRRTPMSGNQRKAFTLIELLIVISIIALLVSIGLPNLRKARKQGKAVVCGSRLHQQGLALTMFMQENNGAIPRETKVAIGSQIAFLTYASFIAGEMGHKFYVDQFPHEAQYAKMEEFQCPDFPKGIPTIKVFPTDPVTYSDDQALDYVYNNFPMSYRPEANEDDLKAVIDHTALPNTASASNPNPLTRISMVRKPSRLIYVSEAHQSLPPHPGVHDVIRGAQLPRGQFPRVAINMRHPGGIHSMFLDIHVERNPPEKQELHDWFDPNAQAVVIR
jgi:prepilin-type N-terminal cleavage/methylation domain-containing protein